MGGSRCISFSRFTAALPFSAVCGILRDDSRGQTWGGWNLSLKSCVFTCMCAAIGARERVPAGLMGSGRDELLAGWYQTDYGPLYRVAFVMLSDPSDAEDAVMDTRVSDASGWRVSSSRSG